MNTGVDIFDCVVGLWVVIFLFITCPLWGIPYVIYNRIKNKKR